MIIIPLGHTEFLVDIKNSEDQNVRILVDTWLSGYAVGDLMERTIQVQLDPAKIETIDAIYISHSHTDHFDPYMLVEIYGAVAPLLRGDGDSQGGLVSVALPLIGGAGGGTPPNLPYKGRNQNGGNSKKPLLLLPYTLAYLVPLIREYLGDIPLEILYPSESFFLKGVEITGYMFPQTEITNEDDVMMLAIANERELLFAEIDTLPEDDNEDVQNTLYQILTRKKYETVCYLASRNELAGQIPLLDAPMSKRKARRAEYIAGRKDEMYASYQKYEYEDFENFSNIYSIPGLVRGFIGQGIAYPQSLSPELYALQIFPLDEIASMEADIARECGYEFPQRALLPGRQYKAEYGTLETGRKECPIGELVSSKQSVVSSDGEQQRLYASGPLFPRDTHDIDGAKQRILEVLNNKFLPYWSASPLASLRAALIQNKGVYRIGFRVSIPSLQRGMSEGQGDLVSEKSEQNPQSHTDTVGQLLYKGAIETIIFEYSTTRSTFVLVPHDASMKIDEVYWLDDILDFLDGRQELYSNFWHRLYPKMIYRLWTCLGANFCNNDLVVAKYRLHFERAARGETSTSFFEEMRKSFAK